MKLTELTDNGVHQSLLDIDGRKIIIGLGWDNKLSMDLSHLEQLAPTIDAILLTHATVAHLGAYAKLAKDPEFAKIPVFATLPVINMGRMVTLDAYRTLGLLGPLEDASLTVSDIEKAFDRVESLKYSQSVNLSKLDVTIVAYNAGHTLGGTVWKIQKEHEDFIYSVDWNHSKDSHLNGAFISQGSLIESFSKPTAMICGTNTGRGVTLAKRRQNIIDTISQFIKNKAGTLLIPTNRVLELVHILDKHWQDKSLGATPLVLFSHVGQRTMSYASSMLEWMNNTIISDWERDNKSPFDTKHLKVVNNLEDLKQIANPKIVLSTDASLEGLSKLAFTTICSDRESLVLLTETHHQPGTLGQKLFTEWSQSQEAKSKRDEVTERELATQLYFKYPQEARLEGEELARYNELIKSIKQSDSQAQAMEMRNQNILEELDNDMDEDDDDDEIDASNLENEKLLVSTDMDVRNTRAMFPYTRKRKRYDDYGEVFKVEDFMRANDKQQLDVHGGKKDAATKIGETRQWVDYDKETHQLDQMSDRAPAPAKIAWVGGEFKAVCGIDFIDFEGLSDANSMEMIIKEIQPKELIMIGDQFLPDVPVKDIKVAIKDEPVLITTSYTYSVKVSDSLESLLKWQTLAGGYVVAHVDGKLCGALAQEEKELVPSDYTLAPTSNQLLVGDIKLNELRKKLVAQGHTAEFRAEGILVCDQSVAVRKVDEGKLEIEGGTGLEFYDTKNVVRQLLARV